MKIYILSQYCNFESYGNSERTIVGVYKHLEDAKERMIKEQEMTDANEYYGDCYFCKIEEREVIP